MAILKVTKNQGFTFSLEDTFLEKPPGVGYQIELLPVFQGLMRFLHLNCHKNALQTFLDAMTHEKLFSKNLSAALPTAVESFHEKSFLEIKRGTYPSWMTMQYMKSTGAGEV